MNNAGEVMNKNKQGRTTLLLILGLFTLPILVVLAMYYFSFRPTGASHGNLINPPFPVRLSPMTTWQNKTFSEADLGEKWSLLYVAPADCNQPCMTQIHVLRQIHAALGKEMGRVQRVMLATGHVNAASMNEIQHDYPDMIILAKPEQAVLELETQLKNAAEADGGTFLIDPLRNAMMHYAPAADPNGMRKDLSHLLRYSWAG